MKTQSEALALIGHDELIGIIRSEIDTHSKLLKAKPAHDTISLSAALEMFDDYGMPTSKAKIYKLTSANEIPHRKYGNKLFFSRQELLHWMEEQAVPIKKVEGRF